MACIEKSELTLRIFGDELDPDVITRQLGSNPTFSRRKGDIVANHPKKHLARTGSWRLEAKLQTPGDLNAQISEILDSLSFDLSVWKELDDLYEIDMFCGLFMGNSMEGIDISADNLKRLGDRHLEIGLDIYGPVGDE